MAGEPLIGLLILYLKLRQFKLLAHLPGKPQLPHVQLFDAKLVDIFEECVCLPYHVVDLYCFRPPVAFILFEDLIFRVDAVKNVDEKLDIGSPLLHGLHEAIGDAPFVQVATVANGHRQFHARDPGIGLEHLSFFN